MRPVGSGATQSAIDSKHRTSSTLRDQRLRTERNGLKANDAPTARAPRPSMMNGQGNELSVCRPGFSESTCSCGSTSCPVSAARWWPLACIAEAADAKLTVSATITMSPAILLMPAAIGEAWRSARPASNRTGARYLFAATPSRTETAPAETRTSLSHPCPRLNETTELVDDW